MRIAHFSRALAAAALLCVAASALAQSTYPTPLGGRVAGVVSLQCDTAGANCQPSNASDANSWAYAPPVGGIVNTTTAVTIKAAAGAGIRNYVCSLQVAHDALGAATELAVRDGAGGTVLWRGKLQITASDAAPNIINLYPCLRGTANTLTEIVTLTAVTGGVFVDAQGYTGS